MITTTRDGGLWTLTLARAAKANALTENMLEALIAGVDEARAAGAQALILTGEGAVFSAGADLDAARAGLAQSPLWEALSGAISDLPALTIAALNGTVAGGAMGMVLACDIRIAVPQARAFYPVMRLGFLPQPSDPPRLVALIGSARAAMILMGGAKVPADEALAWGLFDRVVAPDDLLPTAHALAADALAAAPAHLAAIKAMIPRRLP